jgi:hypothetical protein
VSLFDTNAIVREYLSLDAGLTALVGQRIYCPRLPQNATLPAVGFFTRGGTSNPYIPDMPSPSKQFDCWADNLIDAREVYRALYDALQGIQNVSVTVGGSTYYILSAEEEVQGQDIIDNEIPNYFRVLTFFRIMIRAS